MLLARGKHSLGNVYYSLLNCESKQHLHILQSNKFCTQKISTHTMLATSTTVTAKDIYYDKSRHCIISGSKRIKFVTPHYTQNSPGECMCTSDKWKMFLIRIYSTENKQCLFLYSKRKKVQTLDSCFLGFWFYSAGYNTVSPWHCWA